MVGQEPPNRQRRKHTRSRTGCNPCREKHVRCDQSRPMCTNCSKTRRECQYAESGQSFVIRATKTRFPGVIAPWQLDPVPAKASVDPFDVLPIEMPFKSLDLLKYFIQSDLPEDDPQRCSAVNLTDDPIVCRSAIIFAGLHFAGSHGGRHALETSYLHHKLRCIRDVNIWISDPGTSTTTDCLRLIGTLCISEICLGSMAAARGQVAGVVSLFETRTQSQRRLISAEKQTENDLLERYILMAHSLIELKCEIVATFTMLFNAPDELVERALLTEKNVMKVLRLLLSYVTFDTTTTPDAVDCGSIVAVLRNITSMLTGGGPPADPPTMPPPPQESTASSSSSTASSVPSSTASSSSSSPPSPPSSASSTADDPRHAVSAASGLITDMLVAATELHAYSLLPRKYREQGAFASAWSTMCAASILYVIEGPLSPRRTAKPTPLGTLSHLLRVICQGLGSTVVELAEGRLHGDLWLWQAFVAALAVRKAQSNAAGWRAGMKGLRVPSGQLTGEVNGLVARWVLVTGVTEWKEARRALYSVVWAAGHPEEELERLWGEIVQGEFGSS